MIQKINTKVSKNKAESSFTENEAQQRGVAASKVPSQMRFMMTKAQLKILVG